MNYRADYKVHFEGLTYDLALHDSTVKVASVLGEITFNLNFPLTTENYKKFNVEYLETNVRNIKIETALMNKIFFFDMKKASGSLLSTISRFWIENNINIEEDFKIQLYENLLGFLTNTHSLEELVVYMGLMEFTGHMLDMPIPFQLLKDEIIHSGTVFLPVLKEAIEAAEIALNREFNAPSYKTTFVELLDSDIQKDIYIRILKAGLDADDAEIAMSGRLCDLEDTIDIKDIIHQLEGGTLSC